MSTAPPSDAHISNDRSCLVFVAYRRVSTQKQGASGLGLEAQERMIADYVARVGGRILEKFTEIETGKRADRPELRKALALARRKKAILIVAKLDRLARNVAFVSALMESGADFRAADFPEANRLMIHILSAIAEYEAKLISERTKAGLQSRKLRGFALGTPANLVPGRSPAPRLNRERAQLEAERMRPIIAHIQAQGVIGINPLTEALNERGYTTGRGRQWYPSTVRRLLARLGREGSGYSRAFGETSDAPTAVTNGCRRENPPSSG